MGVIQCVLNLIDELDSLFLIKQKYLNNINKEDSELFVNYVEIS